MADRRLEQDASRGVNHEAQHPRVARQRRLVRCLQLQHPVPGSSLGSSCPPLSVAFVVVVTTPPLIGWALRPLLRRIFPVLFTSEGVRSRKVHRSDLSPFYGPRVPLVRGSDRPYRCADWPGSEHGANR